MLHRHSIMYAVLNSRHAFFPCFYFVTYIVSMTLILTNMLVGVVLDSTAGSGWHTTKVEGSHTPRLCCAFV